mgnify:CR=1 FL=1
MYSLNIDYLFNRVYDGLLWLKYTWLFVILRKSPEDYLAENKDRVWDGLRDRGWFNDYFAKQSEPIPTDATSQTFVEKILGKVGAKDSDHDGKLDPLDSRPYDPSNVTDAQLKERYQLDYNFGDKVRDFFGLAPKDTDGDGVPDSYEVAHGLNPRDPDSDHDGYQDGVELTYGTDPLNNDTDKDLVLDGRDEAPLDPQVTSKSPDADGDGVSDRIETILGTDPNNKDTDGDGLPDGMDTYPLDPNNEAHLPTLDLQNASNGLHLAIQNPVLSFVSDVLSIIALVAICILVYAGMRWFISFWTSLEHYEHHFNHDETQHKTHSISSTHTSTSSHASPVAGLAIEEGDPLQGLIPKPTNEEYETHPRWAIVEGYMSSNVEALWRIGIMEADNMLREVLAERGYQGEDVGEMLRSAHFKTVQLAWDAHLVRNKIAHDGVEYTLTAREAKRVFTLYESVFLELKAIK